VDPRCRNAENVRHATKQQRSDTQRNSRCQTRNETAEVRHATKQQMSDTQRNSRGQTRIGGAIN
jgi:hypothetical protein